MEGMAESLQLQLDNANMHYLIQGQGKPVIFIHGMPTSSFVWRNILPIAAKKAKCFAIDLIGMGKSSKPDINYTITDHINYFAQFIEGLNLSDITLVMHGWGSIIGLSYAMQHPNLVSRIAFVEGYLNTPPEIREAPLPVQELASLLLDKEKAKKLILNDNYFIEKLLPGITLKKLSQDELKVYQEPFKTEKDRMVLWQFILEHPYYNSCEATLELIKSYTAWLQSTPIPKLMMYAIPGFLTSIKTIAWAQKNLPNLTLAEVGQGLHYLPETCAEEIGQALSDWL